MQTASPITKRILLPWLAVFLLSPALAEEASEELQRVRSVVAEKFDMIEAQDVSESPVDGWYTIHKGSVIAYVSADGRYLLQGDLIDLDLEINLSEARRNETRRELMASVSDDQVIAFTPDNVQHTVSIFTDIECTYCRRLHNQIDEYLAAGIEVRYFLYPRNGPASRSWNTSEDVWCSQDRQTALTDAKQDRTVTAGSCDASMVQKHYLLGRDVGLTGTPAIVLDDGTLISGYLPPDRLKARLQQGSAD